MKRNLIGGIASRFRLTVQAFVFCLVLVGLSNVAKASVTYSINNGGLDPFNVSIDGTGINGALAGGIAIHQVSSNPSMPTDYITLCTDIEGTLYLGSSYEYITPTTPFSGQTGVNPTWGAVNAPGNNPPINTANAAQAIQNAAYLFYNYGQLTGTGLGGSTDDKAALQLAVWSALYDTTLNGTVTGSRFSVTGGNASVIAEANSWLSALNTQADAGNFGYTGYLLSPSSLTANGANSEPPQELFIGAAPVPEYSTVIAGALLLLPFGTSAVRILRRNRTT